MTEGPYVYGGEVREAFQLALTASGLDKLPHTPSLPDVKHAYVMAFEGELRRMSSTPGGAYIHAAGRLLDCGPWLLEDKDGRGSLELRPAKDLGTCAGCDRVTEPIPRQLNDRGLFLPQGWERRDEEVLCPNCSGPGCDPRERHTMLEG